MDVEIPTGVDRLGAGTRMGQGVDGMGRRWGSSGLGGGRIGGTPNPKPISEPAPPVQSNLYFLLQLSLCGPNLPHKY